MSVDRMPWFKWWDGTCGDMKFRMVAEDCKLPVSAIIAAWAYLLEYASRAADRGSVAGIDYEVMAYTLQLPDPETVCNAMKRRKMLHDDGTITKWDERQSKRERTEAPGSSTERVRKMRALKKQQENNDLPGGDGGNDNGNDETHVTPGNATKRPKKKNREEEEKKTLTPSSADADGVAPFEQFWEVYPWNAGKQDAHRAWIKVEKNWRKLNSHAPDADMLQTLLAAVAAQKEGDQWKRDGGQYVPRAATWLNGGRWLDEVRPYVAPPVKLPAGWWETHDSLRAAGAMLTPPLEPRTGEAKADFTQRIRAAIGQVDATPGSVPQVAPAAPAAPEYVPPAPPPEVQLTDEQRQARRDEFREQMAKLKQKSGDAIAGVQAANAA